MKIFKPLLILVSTLFTIIVVCMSCENETDNQDTLQTENIVIKVLEKQTAMGDMLLPIGTKVSTLSDSQIDIELPSDFEFLLYTDKEGVSF